MLISWPGDALVSRSRRSSFPRGLHTTADPVDQQLPDRVQYPRKGDPIPGAGHGWKPRPAPRAGRRIAPAPDTLEHRPGTGRLRAAPGQARPHLARLGRLFLPLEAALPPARPSPGGRAVTRDCHSPEAAPRPGPTTWRTGQTAGDGGEERPPPAVPAGRARPHSPSQSPSRSARPPAGSRSRASAAQSPWAARIPPRPAAPAAPAPPPHTGCPRRRRPIGPLPARPPRSPLPLAALSPPRESWRPLIGERRRSGGGQRGSPPPFAAIFGKGRALASAP